MSFVISTDIYVEGPREDLQRLHDKLLPGVENYDGKEIPFGDNYFYWVDKLHFTDEGALHFYTGENKRETPLIELIPQEFPTLRVYYLSLMESGFEGVWSNDEEKKYFDADEIERENV